jgi:hypothetical protein
MPASQLLSGLSTEALLVTQCLGLMTALAAAVTGGTSAAVDIALRARLIGHGGDLAIEGALLYRC